MSNATLACEPIVDYGEPMHSVSVAIIAYNEAKMLPRVWPTIHSQRLPKSFKIIEYLCVSDASTDGTDDFFQQQKKIEPKIRLLRNPKRSGKCAGINHALKKMKGEIIIVANSDCLLAPDNFYNLLTALEDESIMLAGSRASIDPVTQTFITEIHRFIWDIHHEIARIEPKISTAFALKRAAFPGYFPPSCPLDETYLEAYMAKHNVKYHYCPDAQETLRPPVSVSQHIRRRRHYHQGYYWLQRHFPNFKPSTLKLPIIIRCLRRASKNHSWVIVIAAIGLELICRSAGWWDYYVIKRNNAIWQTIHKTTN